MPSLEDAMAPGFHVVERNYWSPYFFGAYLVQAIPQINEEVLRRSAGEAPNPILINNSMLICFHQILDHTRRGSSPFDLVSPPF